MLSFRKSFYESLSHYRAEKSSENQNRLVTTRNQYKTILRNKRYTNMKENICGALSYLLDDIYI